MKRSRYIMLAVAMLPLCVCVQAQTIQARANDIASGVVLLESATEIRVRTAACGGPGPIVVFYAPYTKTRVGTVRCGSQMIDRYQVSKR